MGGQVTSHRVQVMLQPGGKRAKPGQVVGVGADGGDPRWQLLAVELGEAFPGTGALGLSVHAEPGGVLEAQQ